MAIHSSILAWRIPWTEETGELVHGVTESDTTEQLIHTIKKYGYKKENNVYTALEPTEKINVNFLTSKMMIKIFTVNYHNCLRGKFLNALVK